MLELILASNNEHKLAEMSRLFPGCRIRTPDQLGIDFDYTERGGSYLDNAFGKAMSLFGRVHRPVLADDSGLAVEALKGAPGVYSARYGSEEAGRKLSSREQIDFLLAKMEREEHRECSFICCLVLVVEERRFFIAQETVSGVLARQPAGSGGFGYDPIFFLPNLGKTMAELSDEQKDEVSHRGCAARQIRKIISGLLPNQQS